jgi:DNA-directed RNA polymerase subunit E'/Rpb7
LKYHLEIISLINIKMSFVAKTYTNTQKKTNFNQRQQQRQQGLYTQILITRTIPVNINNIGNKIKETLEKAIATQIEGKCIVEGYIKPNTTEIITFSSGLIKGEHVIFEVVFKCDVCSPVEGMNIKCIAKHINKAGIRAEVNEKPSPLIIFIARDHNYTSPLFSQVKENDELKIRVIGQRFELNDKYISIIAELLESNNETKATMAMGIGMAMGTGMATVKKTTIRKPNITLNPIGEPDIGEDIIEVQTEQIQAAPTVVAQTVAAPTLAAGPAPEAQPKKRTIKVASKKPKITIK